LCTVKPEGAGFTGIRTPFVEALGVQCRAESSKACPLRFYIV